MKSILLFAVMTVVFTSCEYDNYKEPNAFFKGALLYNNVDTVFVKQSSGTNIDGVAVYFNLYEPGAAYQNWKSTPIRVVVDAGGSFSALLFADTYKLVLPAGVGPYLSSTDTTVVKVDGSMNLNIPVTPYYLVRNFTPVLTASDSIVTASLKIDQIVTGANAIAIGSVWLYISRTYITDEGNNIAFAKIDGGAIVDPANVVLSAKIPDLAKKGGLGIPTNQKQFFVRAGIRFGNTEVFSRTQVVTFP